MDERRWGLLDIDHRRSFGFASLGSRRLEGCRGAAGEAAKHGQLVLPGEDCAASFRFLMKESSWLRNVWKEKRTPTSFEKGRAPPC